MKSMTAFGKERTLALDSTFNSLNRVMEGEKAVTLQDSHRMY